MVALVCFRTKIAKQPRLSYHLMKSNIVLDRGRATAVLISFAELFSNRKSGVTRRSASRGVNRALSATLVLVGC
jgi:hypothetical protein